MQFQYKCSLEKAHKAVLYESLAANPPLVLSSPGRGSWSVSVLLLAGDQYHTVLVRLPQGLSEDEVDGTAV
jgi:hypothetical protein